MIKFIIMSIVFIVIIFVSRKYFKKWITQFVKNRKRVNEPLPEVNTDLVYTPVLSSRTFQFAIEITEVGDGKAVISVVKAR